MRRGLVVLCAAALVGAGIGLAVLALDVRPVEITTASMSPAVEPGDRVVVHDWDDAQDHDIEHGDIVMFRYPPRSPLRAIKRVVAVGGDTVVVNERSVTVNGRSIPTAPNPPGSGARTPYGGRSPQLGRPFVIPGGQVFLLGDNSAASIDSRRLGPIPHTEIVGKVLFVMPGIGTLVLAALAVLVGGILLSIFWRRDRLGDRMRRPNA